MRCSGLARRPGVAAVMLAKAERATDGALLGAAVPVIPLIESAAGFAQVRAVAAAGGVQRLAFGAIDFQLDMDVQAAFDGLLAFRSELVPALRLARIAAPIDSRCTAIDDPGEVEREAQGARRLGFGATKLCIHPPQVAAVHRGFSPGAAEPDGAERVLAAAAASQGAAVALDGKMIDKPVILRAPAVLAARRAC